MAKLCTLVTTICFLTLATSPSFCEGQQLERCPYVRGLNAPFDGRLNAGWLGWTFNESVCHENATRAFSWNGAYTTVILHQTNEIWNENPRKDEVLSAIEDAINSGLGLIATLAGNASNPLDVHVTLANLKETPTGGSLVFFDNNGVDFYTSIANPCYLIVGFPELKYTDPLVSLKKDLVKNMYHCVQQYYHGEWDLSLSLNENWWRESTARFVDGLLWPSPPELLRRDGGGNVKISYPEEYKGFLALVDNWGASSLFWHWAHTNEGWSLGRITDWVKRRERPEPLEFHISEETELAADVEIRELFHGFAQAYVLDSVMYPSGTPIKNIRSKDAFGTEYGTWWEQYWDKAILVELGKTRDIGAPELVQITPWSVLMCVVPLAGGQTLDITIRTQNSPGLPDRSRDVTWSWRIAGEVEFRELGSWQGGTERIMVPSDAPNTTYEFLVTSTRGREEFDVNRLEIKMMRLP